eukprot:jgi/Chrzof1/506/Cz01g18100.t1
MQLFVKGVHGRTHVLHVAPEDTILCLKQAIQACEHIPTSEQLLSYAGKPLHDSVVVSASHLQPNCTVHASLRLCGGKGGFGALLKNQGRDGKITDNFDACRDLSGRRIRHVEAEKKLQEWQAQAKERELEKIAYQHMKELAKQAKRDKYEKVHVTEVKQELQEAAAKAADAVQNALAEGIKDAAGSSGAKRKAVAQAEAGPSSKRPKALACLTMLEGSDDDDDDDSDDDDEQQQQEQQEA